MGGRAQGFSYAEVAVRARGSSYAEVAGRATPLGAFVVRERGVPPRGGRRDGDTPREDDPRAGADGVRGSADPAGMDAAADKATAHRSRSAEPAGTDAGADAPTAHRNGSAERAGADAAAEGPTARRNGSAERDGADADASAADLRGSAEQPVEAGAASGPDGAAADLAEDTDLEDLGDRIATLAAHISAAEYRLLVMLAEFDRRAGWRDAGHRTCAAWLAHRIGLGTGAARQRVRVARALESLPLISATMERGKLSFSKEIGPYCPSLREWSAR
jgi:hypothetical protein